MMELVQIGAHFRDFPLAIREAVRKGHIGQTEELRAWREAGLIQGAVILATCNREELYAATLRPIELANLAARRIRECLVGSGLGAIEIESRIHKRFGSSVVRHLMRVAGSLDSMLVGESQILGQVKSAYVQSERDGLLCPELNQLFQQAIKTAKAIRRQTPIGRGCLGLDAVAVDCLLREEIPPGAPVAVVGAGQLGVGVVRGLMSRGYSNLRVFNRSGLRSDKLAALGAIPLHTVDRLAGHLSEARAVILVASVDTPLLSAEMVTGRGSPLLVIDLGLPANADRGLRGQASVTLYNLDDLKDFSAERFRQRQEAIEVADALIEEGLIRWMHETRLRLVGEVLASLKERSNDFRRNLTDRLEGELDRFEAGLQPQVVEAVRLALGRMEHALLSEVKRHL